VVLEGGHLVAQERIRRGVAQETQPFQSQARQTTMDRGWAKITAQRDGGVRGSTSVIDIFTDDRPRLTMQVAAAEPLWATSAGAHVPHTCSGPLTAAGVSPSPGRVSSSRAGRGEERSSRVVAEAVHGPTTEARRADEL